MYPCEVLCRASRSSVGYLIDLRSQKYSVAPQETAAAIKLQAAYRRGKVMNDLERQGATTMAIRKRAQRRRVHKLSKDPHDFSNAFGGCCGFYLALTGEMTEEDYEAQREYQKLVYEEKKKAVQAREEKLREQYTKSMMKRRQKRDDVSEAYETVEEGK